VLLGGFTPAVVLGASVAVVHLIPTPYVARCKFQEPSQEVTLVLIPFHTQEVNGQPNGALASQVRHCVALTHALDVFSRLGHSSLPDIAFYVVRIGLVSVTSM